MNEVFRHIAKKVSDLAGNVWTFTAAVALIVGWIVTGPLFHYSQTWQLFINTCTTIITFLMVFLIQNTQHRESKAVNLKLDELIRALRGARNDIIHVEELSDQELEELEKIYYKISEEKQKRQKHRTSK